ncbi:MAG: hypothetical protein JWM11_742, partial [Planctomycetaceae bacterium]|nr:hypothetical protein [Planctomycetaceae bacterium]
GFAAELCQRNFVTKVTSIAVSQSASITTLTIQGFTNQIVKEHFCSGSHQNTLIYADLLKIKLH